MPQFAVILPAAGKSSRFRDKEKKPFTNLDGRAVWLRCVELFVTRNDVCQCIVVVNPDDQEMFRRRYGANLAFMNVELATGGAERADSVRNALARVRPEADFVAVHDAARPLLVQEWIDRVFRAAEQSGAAILATPVTSTLKRSRPDGTIEETWNYLTDYGNDTNTSLVFRSGKLAEIQHTRWLGNGTFMK